MRIGTYDVVDTGIYYVFYMIEIAKRVETVLPRGMSMDDFLVRVPCMSQSNELVSLV